MQMDERSGPMRNRSQSSAMSAASPAPIVQALEQARLAVGLSDPNPRVGCVLCDGAGRVRPRCRPQVG